MTIAYNNHFAVLLACFVLVHAAGQVDVSKGLFSRKDFPERTNTTNPALTTKKPKDNHSHKIDLKRIQPDKRKKIDAVPVLAQTGSTALLHCNIEEFTVLEMQNMTVIWMKLNSDDEFTTLTNNSKVLAYDKRFYATNKMNIKDWVLYIRYTQTSDEGLYLCQTCLNSTSSNNTYTQLKLKEAQAKIIGGSRKEVKKPGSPLRLSCVLENSIEAPAYIFWYRGDKMINYDLDDGATVREGRQGSELIIPMAQKEHAGNYSCVPSNAQQASVEVVFLSTTSDVESGAKSSGKKYYPQCHNLNMLVFISALHFHRLQT